MNSNPGFRHVWLTDRLLPAQAADVARRVEGLRRMAGVPSPRQLLRGKNIALVCETDDPDSHIFHAAAAGLGARDARVRPTEAGLLPGRDLRDLARMLGKLYDAIECEGMRDEVVVEIAEHSGVPVFNGIGSRAHPLVAWAQGVDGHDPGPEADPQAGRKTAIQALLLSALR